MSRLWGRRGVSFAVTVMLAAHAASAAGEPASPPDEVQRDQLAVGRSALRAMDCARCHGRDLDGWAAPSLIAAVRDGSRERFERIVLDGEITRGMPGYRGMPAVVDALDAIYAYLVARAGGGIVKAPPPPAHEGQPRPKEDILGP